jgi:hypothetical protein
MVNIIVIYPGGKYANISSKVKNLDNLKREALPTKISKFLGKGDLSHECDFNLGEGKIVSVFAFEDGVAGKENKFDMPPPIDTQLYFGCIIVVASKEEKLIDFSKSDFDSFYEKAFGGFEDLGNEDTWSEEEEENTEDRDFIVGDDEEIEEESNEEEEEEEYIDTDTNTDEEDIYVSDVDKEDGDGDKEQVNTNLTIN